ncbi:MAG: iron-containing alcohol dehydrogenase [Treponema sp.]|nr:iron-containing alcohol dehydrogenase [Treponema sp.]
MMRPMKLAGSELLFGKGALAYLKQVKAGKTAIVIGGSSMLKSGILKKVEDYLHESGSETFVISGVEADPHFSTVMRGAGEMKKNQPDLIVALGGGSVMDAAKTMWIYYEHEELSSLEELFPPHVFPKLHTKARFCCIPSTSGTASEVSRSVVITDDKTGLKRGLGNMEMMPDIAICDPEVTVSMPPRITAETGMDALTHALEALVSNRANYVSDILAERAVEDIFANLPQAYADGTNMAAREKMIDASMIAGLAFTNVSLGIVHSMAHTVGSFFHISHGLADAILLPYVMKFNTAEPYAKAVYERMTEKLGCTDIIQSVAELNRTLGIPSALKEVIQDREQYMKQLDRMAEVALADGCTKTNPIIPTVAQFKELLTEAYNG